MTLRPSISAFRFPLSAFAVLIFACTAAVCLSACHAPRPVAQASLPAGEFAGGAATIPAQRAIPSIPTATLLWDSTETNVTFNIYSGPAPQTSALRLRANTAAASYTVPRTNAQEYFGVKAVRAGVESPWAEVPR